MYTNFTKFTQLLVKKHVVELPSKRYPVDLPKFSLKYIQNT